jgi:hypothetical protein
MMKNKRSTPRQDLALEVDIFNSSTYLGRSTIRDIHIDGAFIEADNNDLFRNDILELRFIPDADEIKPVCLRAMVVRGSDDGVGVIFSYGEHDFRNFLKKLFKYIRYDYSNAVA